MLKDQYGNALSTTSTKARDAYVRALDLYLSADTGIDEAFEAAIAEDENFVLAHLGLARNQQINAKGREARQTHAKAKSIARDLTSREQGHFETMSLLLEGKSADGHVAARKQLADHPRDILIAQACLGVFGLIGFSGQPGREAETLALAETLAPAYGDDWWFLSALSFAQIETGQTGPAAKTIERSLALNPRNANAAHHRAHLYYEVGETDAGYDYLQDWLKSYDREAIMHCHLSWHIALWALARGDVDTMWATVDADLDPSKSHSPPLNVLTDMAAILYRANLAGVDIPKSRWTQLSDYAAKCFPKPGLAFADVHAALTHAMAGNGEALQKVISDARGPAADLVIELAEAFQAIATQNWPAAKAHLKVAMQDHARIGGSRAQRDMIEYAMAFVLMKLGKQDEAKRLMVMRRPDIMVQNVR